MAERVRVGIIGANLHYGWGARAHIPALLALPQFELIAVCTTQQQTAEETARHFGIPMALADPQQLVQHPEIDLVTVCVRVPRHHELVMMALAAGKPVYCEWPLGANTEQAIQLRDLARRQQVVQMVGLQARGAPIFNRVRDLVLEGYVGRVLSTTLFSSTPGLGGAQRPAGLAWAADQSKGATTLTIPGGHSLDVLCFCLGEFQELTATVVTQVKQATVIETGETLEVTAPDHVLVNGVLESGAVASVHVASGAPHGTGLFFEINGSEGALVVSSQGVAQIAELCLRGARRGERELHELPIPERYRWVPPSVPAGPPFNVAQLYVRLAEGLRAGKPVSPDFEVAATRHHLLDVIQRAAATGSRQRV